MIAFLKFVFGPMPVWRAFRYNSQQQLWCPLCLEWHAPKHHMLLPELTYVIWIRRARRWFQGKRDHQTP